MLRCSAVGIVCNKTLQLSTAAVAQFSDAPLTLMSADVERIGSGLSNIHDAWAGIIETSLAIWLLKINLGVAVVAPLVLILSTSPILSKTYILTNIACLVIGIFLALAVGKHQKTWLEAIQRRISVTSSILGSLKNIKISGFAEELSTNIKDLRDTEIHASEKFRWLLVLNVCLCKLTTDYPMLLLSLTKLRSISIDHHVSLCRLCGFQSDGTWDRHVGYKPSFRVPCNIFLARRSRRFPHRSFYGYCNSSRLF